MSILPQFSFKLRTTRKKRQIKNPDIYGTSTSVPQRTQRPAISPKLICNRAESVAGKG